MKKLMLSCLLISLGILLFGQVTDNTQPPVTVATEDLDIQIKAFMPDISVIQVKTETYSPPGVYNFTINLDYIRRESKKQLEKWQNELNIWLEESK